MAAPPGVKHGLALIAESKRISVSYMLEQIMIEVYGNAMRRMGIERPLYIKRKEK